MKRYRSLCLGLAMAALAAPFGTPAEEGSSYKIGAAYPLTGHLSWLGEYYQKAAELQVDLINQEGGINGRQLEVVIYDDHSSPEGAARASHRLISRDRVVALMGTASVPMSRAMVSVGAEHSIPTVVMSGYTVTEESGPFAFNSAHRTDYAVSRPFAYFARNDMRRVALLMPNGPLGEIGIDAAQKAAAEHSIDIVGTERFNVEAPDLTSQLARIRREQPDVVFSFVTGEPAALVARNMAQIGLRVPLMVSHGNATPGFLRMIGGSPTEVLIPSGKLSVPGDLSENDPSRDVITRFNEAHEERYGEPANYFSGLAADAVLLVAEGLRRASSADGVALRDAMLQIRDLPGYGGVFNLSEDDRHGTTADDMVLLKPENGSWTRLD